jgi:hypothetical protein
VLKADLWVAYVNRGRYQEVVEEYKILKDLNQELTNELFKFIYK